MSDIKPAVRDMADTIKPHLSVGDVKAGAGVISAPDDLYEKTLEGTGLTMDVVKKVQNHNAVIVPAFAQAVGEVSNGAMKKDKDLDSVAGTMAIGKDKLSVHYSRTGPVVEGKEPEYGEMLVNYRVQAAESKASLNAVKRGLAEEARNLFAK